MDYSAYLGYILPPLKKGQPGGVAELNSSGKIPSEQLPSYVDDVVEYDSLNDFPLTGEEGKIYVNKENNGSYRWSGSDYILIGGIEPFIINITLNENTIELDQTKASIFNAFDNGQEIILLSDRPTRYTPAPGDNFTYKYKAYIINENTLCFNNMLTQTINNKIYVVNSLVTIPRQEKIAIGWSDFFILSGDDVDIPVLDVQINGTSVVLNGVANIPIAGSDNFGVIKVNSTYGIVINPLNGLITTNTAGTNVIKEGTNQHRPIAPYYQHTSVFYGLAKAAGDSTQSASTLSVGTYTDLAKTAIQNMLDVPSLDIISRGTGDYSVKVNDIAGNVASGTYSYAEGFASTAYAPYSHALGVSTLVTGVISHAEGYKTIAAADHSHALGLASTAFGYSSHAEGYYTKASGMTSHAEGQASTASGNYSHAEGNITTASGTVSHAEGQASTASGNYSHAEGIRTLASGIQSHAEGRDTIASGGRSHAEGVSTTASGECSHVEGYATIANHVSQHTFGEYNIADPSMAASTVRGNYVEIVGNGTANDARSNARALDWDGNEYLSGNVYVLCSTNSLNGKRLISDIQLASTSITNNGIANIPIANSNTPGVIKISPSYGIGIINDFLMLNSASSALIKSGNNSTKPISAYNQHQAVFYGLAKVAGDTTQSASTLGIGTYTTEAKSAIQDMLGITNGNPVLITVASTAPVINGSSNTRYICGLVSSITINPPETGTIDVVFTSGSTATALTLGSTTIKMPEWFDASNLLTNKIYLINILNGIYGAVMTWPV